MQEHSPPTYIVKWSSTNETGFVRGILPDRRFYGEYKDIGLHVATRHFDGTVSPSDYARLLWLINDIASLSLPLLPAEDCDCLLAEGVLGASNVIFRHKRDVLPANALSAFNEIVLIMKKYL